VKKWLVYLTEEIEYEIPVEADTEDAAIEEGIETFYDGNGKGVTLVNQSLGHTDAEEIEEDD